MSSSKKIIISIALILMLVCGGVTIYLFNFTPEARAKTLASNYMNALLINDTQAANNLYPSKPPNASIVQRNYRLEATTLNAGVYYIFYSFTDSLDPSKLRIAVSSQSIENVVSGSHLGAKPSEDKKVTIKQTQQSRCLDKTDLAFLDSTSVYAKKIRGATMIFASKSTDYSVPDLGEKLLDRMANFYNQADEKDFVFELKGYQPTTGLSQDEDKALDDLFQRRSTKLQKGLIDRGVPLDRIDTKDKYSFYIPEQAAALENDLYVDINIINRCTKE